MSTELSSLVSVDWLNACPTGVIVLEHDQLLWGNPALERMIAGPLESLTPQRLQVLRRCDGPVTINPGTPEECRVRCRRADGLICSDLPIEVYFVEDVSRELSLAEERDQLENKVRELTLTDELTGLPNRRALGSALAAQVTRSRRYHNPLAMAMVRPTCGLGDAAPPDAVMLAVSRFLRDRLRWADIIGREDEQTFMLILPETDQVAANGVIQQIRDEVSAVRLPPPHESRQLKLSIGLAQWRRGLDGAGLVAEARQGLAAA